MPSDLYKKNHGKIFGPPKPPTEKTPAEQTIHERLRRETHKAEVAAGKKDAQYYVDNEVRVSSNPDYRPKPRTSEEYKQGWERIYGPPEQV